MRIAQVAPLVESVPPLKYGGTERVAHVLTEELGRRGHEVVLYASGDSRTSAELRSPCPTCLRHLEEGHLHASQIVQIGMVYSDAGEFDVIHSHLEHATYPAARLSTTPTLHTLHGRLDLPYLPRIYRHYREQPLVSISDAQRKPLAWANWLATIHHGLDLSRFPFYPVGGDYLAYVSRLCPEKCSHEAIELCLEVGVPLKVAGKVDRVDRDYFEARVRPLLSSSLIEYVGEITDQERNTLLGGALGFLFTLDWPEPFGLVTIESMAVGTPVIARPVGSLPELVVDGVTGFLCPGLPEMAAAIPELARLDRIACRRWVEEHFTAEQMAARYEKVYEELANRSARPLWRRGPVSRLVPLAPE